MFSGGDNGTTRGKEKVNFIHLADKSLRTCPLSFEKSRGIVEPHLNKHPFALHFKWKELPKAGCLLIVIARLRQLTVEVARLSEKFFC